MPTNCGALSSVVLTAGIELEERVDMPAFHFTLIVEGPDLQAPSLIDSLYDAGCDDAAVGCAHAVCRL